MASSLALFILFTSVLGAFAAISADCNGLAYQAALNPSEQFGYNVCNSTTENQSSLCQTAFINSVDDFCLWGPANPVTDLPLSENEVQQVVAWCTKPGHGARVIPPNAFNVTIFIKTPNYIEVLGWFDESFINYPTVRSIADYPATEWPSVNLTAQLDPQGSDGKGGPIGGLMFSNAYANSNVKNWISMIGPGGFMIRACDPSIAGAAAYCTRWPGDTYWTWFVFFDPSYFPEHATSVSPGYQSCTGPSIPIGAYVAADNTTQTYTGGNPPSMVPVAPQVVDCTAYNSQDINPTTFTITNTQVCAATLRSSPPSTSISSSARTGAIVGAIVGGLVLVALIAFLCIWKRRRSRRAAPVEEDANIDPEPFMSERTTNVQPSHGEIRKMPLPTAQETSRSTEVSDTSISPLSPRSAAGTSKQAGFQSSGTLSTFPRGSSTVGGSTVIHGSPPAYSEVSGPPPSVGPGSELALWAQDNRDIISPDLEARLREAHYLPSDNPDEIPEDVWSRDYGIRHFELKRLRQLYAQRAEGTSSIG